MEELRLPDLGENIEKAEVAAVLVRVGDRVERDQPVVEVETEKANLEVPAEQGGIVAELRVKPGDTIAVGQTILTLEPGAEAGGPEAGEKADRATRAETGEGAGPGADEEQDEEAALEAVAVEAEDGAVGSPAAGPPRIGPTVPAAPSVRALARELGVDLFRVEGSGPGGRISAEDVKAHAKAIVRGSVATGPAAETPPLPDLGQWGEIERERLSNVRRATARNLAVAWANVPHVTQFDRADVTQIESMRRRFNERPEAAGKKLTMTAIVIKLVAAALKQFPKFNAVLDLAGDAVVYRKYVHIGVAVDTERGLLVPVIRDVDGKSLLQVAAELAELAARARDKKLGLEEMRGAGFTVSNLGGLGTTYFSPIVAWPQVAILGVGRASQEAVWDGAQFQPRLIMPLSVSYDHRLIDGADAARFLRWLAEALEQPLLLLIDE